MTEPLVHYHVEQGAAWLTLDSPANRNALSTRLVAELRAGLDRAAADPAARSVVLTHTGGVFCAGADLSEATGADPADTPRRLVEVMRAVLELPKPVIARADGHVRAGGLGLIGVCDLAVAGPKCTFAFTEVRLGLAPAVISLPLLARLEPRAAARWYLTGEPFNAAEAARIGLVTAAAEDADAALDPMLAALAKASPQGLAETKRLVTASVLAVFQRDADQLVDLSARLFSSPEAQEGMRAFLERRPPAWAEPAQ